MAFKASERLPAYTALLTKEGGLNAEDLLNLNDMIAEDLNAREAADTAKETAEANATQLRDVNHRLFLRVTGGTAPTTVEKPELSPEEASEAAFNKLITEGVL